MLSKEELPSRNYLMVKTLIMAKIKVTKNKSAIKRPKNQKLTLEAMGLRKIGQSNEFEVSDSLMGMINKVKHLVSVQEIN